MQKLLFFFLLLLVSSLPAQSFYHDFTASDTGAIQTATMQVVPMPGGGVLTAGRYQTNTNGTVTNYMRIDSSGNLRWSKTLVLTPDFYENLRSDSTGCYFCGFYSMFYPYVQRTDTAFNLTWARRFYGYPAGYHSFALDCQPAHDGGCFVTGEHSSQSLGHVMDWEARLTPNGDSVWSKTYDWSGYEMEFLQNNVEMADGGVVVPFYAHRYDSLSHEYMTCGLIRLNDTGGVMWANCYSDSTYRMPHNLLMLPDSSFMLYGVTDVGLFSGTPVPFLLHTDRNGNFKWCHYLLRPASGGLGIVQLPNGKLLSNYSDVSAPVSKGEFVEWDTTGQVTGAWSLGGADTVVLGEMTISNGKIITAGGTVHPVPATSYSTVSPLLVGFYSPAGGVCSQAPDTITFAVDTIVRTDHPSITVMPGLNIIAMPMALKSDLAMTERKCGPDGVEENAEEIQPLLFPDPASSVVKLTWNDDAAFSQLEIFSATGALVKRMAVQGNKAEVDVSAFSPGIYFCVLRNSSSRQTAHARMIIAR